MGREGHFLPRHLAVECACSLHFLFPRLYLQDEIPPVRWCPAALAFLSRSVAEGIRPPTHFQTPPWHPRRSRVPALGVPAVVLGATAADLATRASAASAFGSGMCVQSSLLISPPVPSGRDPTRALPPSMLPADRLASCCHVLLRKELLRSWHFAMVSARCQSANLASSRLHWSVLAFHGFLPRADQEAFHCGAGIHDCYRVW